MQGVRRSPLRRAGEKVWAAFCSFVVKMRSLGQSIGYYLCLQIYVPGFGLEFLKVCPMFFLHLIFFNGNGMQRIAGLIFSWRKLRPKPGYDRTARLFLRFRWFLALVACTWVIFISVLQAYTARQNRSISKMATSLSELQRASILGDPQNDSRRGRHRNSFRPFQSWKGRSGCR